MSWAWILGGAIVLGVLFSIAKWIRLLLTAFVVAAAALLYLHAQTNPAEAAPALAMIGGGLVFGFPIRRLLRGGWL